MAFYRSEWFVKTRTKAQDINLAKTYFDRFISIEPNSAAEHNYYAIFLTAHFLAEFKELAIEHYETACDLDPTFESDAVEILLYRG